MEYLFNSYGEWIAFRDEDFVYNPAGDFLGYIGRDQRTVLDYGGQYFGTVYGNRLYRKLFPAESVPRNFRRPQHHEPPDPPPPPGFADIPFEADEIRELAPK